MAKLGNVNLSITDESINDSVDATSYPVEKGEPFSDHISLNPKTISLSGFVLGKDADTRLNKLRESMRKGEILSYVGRTVVKNVVILSVDDNRTSEVANGSSVSIKLQVIRIVNTSWKKTTKAGKKQVITNRTVKTTYHIVKKGETYSSIAKKYGVSVSSLRKLNKYKDTAILIGAKLKIR